MIFLPKAVAFLASRRHLKIQFPTHYNSKEFLVIFTVPLPTELGMHYTNRHLANLINTVILILNIHMLLLNYFHFICDQLCKPTVQLRKFFLTNYSLFGLKAIRKNTETS